jgi:hypothetical protein
MDTSDKKRQQFTDVLNISISPARCATHLKQYLVNNEIEKEIKDLRSEWKSNDISDTEKENIKLKISELSKKIVRISNETSTVIAIICNEFITDLLKHGINETIKNNKKIVDIASILSGNHEQSIYYSIYYKLPSFNKYDPKVYETIKKEKLEHSKKNKKSKAVELVEDEAVEEEVETKAEDEHVEDGNKITFNSYIDSIRKCIKKEAQYENVKIRVDSEVRDYLSNMIIECIKRFVVLSKIIVQQIMGVRTMNSSHIKAIIHMFMKDEGNTDEQISVIINNIDDKLKIYHEHIRNEKANRFNELSEEQKQQIMESKESRMKDRKQKDLRMAERRAAEAAERLKKLNEVV